MKDTVPTSEIPKDHSVSLVSLAMLKVNSDLQGRDYIEYLRPFVKHVLVGMRGDPITDASVRDKIEQEFALRIPTQVIHYVLKRFRKSGYFVQEDGIYRLEKNIKDGDLGPRKAQASREIGSVVSAFAEYAEITCGVKLSPDECTTALLAFVSQFSVQCVRTYVSGTALPELPEASARNQFFVHSFVKTASEKDSDLFEHIMVIVKGYMLSNALLCPDLESTQKTFKHLKVFLDTPLILDLLGLHGETDRTTRAQCSCKMRRP
ncbi:MAG: hypothetical protein HON70_21730, partial [Lentisphaerae bacterium]|nr:hypothetical protein [Lentisphaerota bacterium]